MKTSIIIGEILAAWEDSANIAATDCHNNAEDDAFNLLRDDKDAPKFTDEEKRNAWTAVENGRELARAWRIISNGLRRYLRILNVPTYGKRRADEANEPMTPWEHRRAHEAMGPNIDAPKHERGMVVLDKDKLESTAREHGLWKDEDDEPTS